MIDESHIRWMCTKRLLLLFLFCCFRLVSVLVLKLYSFRQFISLLRHFVCVTFSQFNVLFSSFAYLKPSCANNPSYHISIQMQFKRNEEIFVIVVCKFNEWQMRIWTHPGGKPMQNVIIFFSFAFNLISINIHCSICYLKIFLTRRMLIVNVYAMQCIPFVRCKLYFEYWKLCYW